MFGVEEYTKEETSMKQTANRMLYPSRQNSSNPDGSFSCFCYVHPAKCWDGTYHRIDHNGSISFEN
jgi:hypothetical protein